MIISFILSKWRSILDFALIIGIVFLIFYINPWSMFGNKTELQPTANMVSQVRDIGQLVTAEYYGEVVSSWEEGKLNFMLKDSVTDEGEFMLNRIKYTLGFVLGNDTLSREAIKEKFENNKKIRKIYLKGIKQNNIVEVFDEQYKVEKDSLYYLVIDFINITRLNENSKFDKFLKKDRAIKDEKKVLLALYRELRSASLSGDDAVENFLEGGFNTNQSFSEYYFGIEKEEWSKKDRKKELAIIGRGWVKAGYDFSSLDEDDFHYDKEDKTIHFFGLKPVILDKDINPWFIPEREIPGFQILHSNRHAKFEDVVKLKSYCIDKLQSNAQKSNIIESAQENGMVALQGFFSLLTGVEIRRVVFHNESIKINEGMITADQKISQSELPIIDSIYSKNLLLIDSLNAVLTSTVVEANKTKLRIAKEKRKHVLEKFFEELKRFPLALSTGETMPFNYFTARADEVGLDSLISDFHLKKIDSLHTSWTFSKGDSLVIPQSYTANYYWFRDSLQFINEYNSLIREIHTQNLAYIEGLVDTIPSNKKDSIRQHRTIHLENQLAGKYFPEIDYESWEHFLVHSKTWPEEVKKQDSVIFKDNDYAHQKAEIEAIRKVMQAHYEAYNGKTNIKRASREFNHYLEEAGSKLRKKLNQARREISL